MITAYTELFSTSDTRRLALAGLLARIALPMTGIGIIIMLSQLMYSYTLAGAVSATFVLTYALLSPQSARLIDRYGQDRILPFVIIISSIGFLILIITAWQKAAAWLLFLGAILAGCMPSISAMIRARWSMIYRNDPRLQTAYSLETVLDELTFIVGPPLAIFLSVQILPQASLMISVLLLIAGSLLLLLQQTPKSYPEQPEVTSHSHSIIRSVQVWLLTLLMVAMGIIVGTIDIVSVAFAKQLNQPTAASLVLSAYAFGSCISGLIFGTLKLQRPLSHRLLIAGIATAISIFPLLWVDNMFIFIAVIFVSGLCFAPTMIISMSLIEQFVPAHRLTEGLTWLLAGLNIGVACGAAISGQVIDQKNAEAGFMIAIYASVTVFILTVAAFYCLRQRRVLI